MDAVSEPVAKVAPRKRWFSVTPAIEVGVLAVVIGVAVISYFVIGGVNAMQRLISPPVIALVLIANLLACGTLIVLVGRRIAQRRAARSPAGGRAQLHVRLVAIFSAMAMVPTVLLAVIASLLFQDGAEFWFSGRARGMLDNAQSLANSSYGELLRYVENENVAMANDVTLMVLREKWPIESNAFVVTFQNDVLRRSLSNSVLFSITRDGKIQPEIIVKNSENSPVDEILPEDIRKVQTEKQSVTNTNAQRTYSLARVLGTNLYLYSTREGGAQEMATRLQLAKAVWQDYQSLLTRSRSIQLQFHAALLFISLLVIGIVVFVALAVADRLVRPINELVGAARRVAGGDLTARVTTPVLKDEVATLGDAFNSMTEQLQAQTTALVTANAQIESRRALIEAVMSGVTAGVVSIDSARKIRLINASAMAMLAQDEAAVGQPLGGIAPELDALLNSDTREAVVQVTVGSDARTLAVKVTRDEAGQVLTFDDITQQLLDQRRAAWSDVARRIAHEIKNPLTPIQLAAERLQRRYGKTIDAADTTFARLTDTIVRQVGDLRRIVDEFSSFARMPKPLFREESLLDIGRQAMFLHEVAHPAIRFEVNAPEDPIVLVSDRRQIGQALTNVVKNAVEAIEARGEGEALPQGEIVMTLRADEGRVVLTVADNGIGLPVERDRIVEPYMTTRSRGTGLGLAIVKKIIEEHFGTIAFSDRPGGGTVVTIAFDSELLANMGGDTESDADGAEPRPAALTRTGNTKS
ncbi:MAG: ATP-binding protein [Pseudomonadota bacterium]